MSIWIWGSGHKLVATESCTGLKGNLDDFRLERFHGGDELNLEACARLWNGWGRATETKLNSKGNEANRAVWLEQRTCEVLYKPKMVWTLSLSHRKYWKVRFKEGWNIVGKILNAKGRLLTLWLCQLLDVWPQAKLVSLCEHWLPHLWTVGVNNHLIELFWG